MSGGLKRNADKLKATYKPRDHMSSCLSTAAVCLLVARDQLPEAEAVKPKPSVQDGQV